MRDELHRLVYYSRNRMPADELRGAIDQILATSRHNNTPVGITGMLMFNAGCFAQVLEGPRTAIEATFERIQQDDRHGEVSLIAFEPVASRTFGGWSMGFVGARKGDANAYAGVAVDSGFDIANASGDELLVTLQRLALEDEALA